MTGGRRLSVCLLLILFAAGSNSQEDEPGWYEVELLVFQYTGEHAAAREIFPLLPELRYAKELRRLRQVDGRIEWEQTWQLRRVEELIPTPPWPGREPPPAAPHLPTLEPENGRELSTPELDNGRGLAAPELDYSVPAAFCAVACVATQIQQRTAPHWAAGRHRSIVPPGLETASAIAPAGRADIDTE